MKNIYLASFLLYSIFSCATVNAQNVGIGTASPQEKLHINGSLRGNQSGAVRISTGYGYLDIGPKNTSWSHFQTDRPRFHFNTGMSIAGGEISSYATSNLSLQTNETTRMTILQSNGNVGIGTTNPTYKLDVSGTGRFTGQVTVPLLPSADASAASKKYVDDQVGAVTETDPSWTGTANTTGSISRTGNVGIGTSSPNTKLTIDGAIEYAGNPRYYQNLASYNSSASSVVGIMKIVLPKSWSNTMMQIKIKGFNYSSDRGAWELTVGGYNYASSTSWHNYNTTVTGSPPFAQVRLAHDGTRNVILLGDVSTVWSYPKLNVTEFTAGHSSLDGWGTGWSIEPIASEAGITSAVEAPIRIYVQNNGNVGIGLTNPTYKLHVNGRIRSNGINETSDERMKKDIVPLKNALEKVEALQGVSYFWRVDEFPEMDLTSRKEIGVIAQEIEKILPEVVNTDGEGYKSVQYSHLVPVLIEAIKEQQVIINQQKKIQDNLANRISANEEGYKAELAQKDCEIAQLNSNMNDLNNQVLEIKEMLQMSVKKD